jgi:hypothetical protein
MPEFNLMGQLLATLNLSTWLDHRLSVVNSLAKGTFGVHYCGRLSAQKHLNLRSGVNSAQSRVWLWRGRKMLCKLLTFKNDNCNATKSKCLLNSDLHLELTTFHTGLRTYSECSSYLSVYCFVRMHQAEIGSSMVSSIPLLYHSLYTN